MSAYIVDKAHIDAMVRAAETHRAQYFYEPNGQPGGRGSAWTTVTRDERDRIGQLLLDANVVSVSYRYPDDDLTDLPGRVDAPWIIPYRYNPAAPILTAVAALKAINGYEYQSCEPPTWEASEAHAFCEGLRGVLIRALPGYEKAAWTIEDEAATSAPVGLLDLADDWRAFRDAYIPGGE